VGGLSSERGRVGSVARRDQRAVEKWRAGETLRKGLIMRESEGGGPRYRDGVTAIGDKREERVSQLYGSDEIHLGSPA